MTSAQRSPPRRSPPLGRLRTEPPTLSPQCHHPRPPPLPPRTPASPCSAWNKNLCCPGWEAYGPPQTRTACLPWWRPTRSWNTCGRTSPASSRRSSSACPRLMRPSTTTLAWRRVRASETSSTVTLGTSLPWISDRAGGRWGARSPETPIPSPQSRSPSPWPSSPLDWRHLIYTPAPETWKLFTLESGRCQGAEQAEKGRSPCGGWEGRVCTHPPPCICSVRSVRACVCMDRGMKGNPCARGDHAPVVATHVCTCLHIHAVGTLNCTFGSLLQGPHAAWGGHLALASCLLTRLGGEALAC